MSYSKTTWAQGDKITSALLNKMEQGIYDAAASGTSFIVSGTLVSDDQTGDDYITINKTTAEIYSVASSGTPVFLFVDDDGEISQWMLTETDEGKDEDIYADFVSVSYGKDDGVIIRFLTFHSNDDGEEETKISLSKTEDTEPYSVAVTRSVDGNSKQVLTFPLTALEAYNIANKGRVFLVSFTIEEGISVTSALNVGAIKADVNGAITYMFRTDSDKTYISANLSANDPVVMTEV